MYRYSGKVESLRRAWLLCWWEERAELRRRRRERSPPRSSGPLFASEPQGLLSLSAHSYQELYTSKDPKIICLKPKVLVFYYYLRESAWLKLRFYFFLFRITSINKKDCDFSFNMIFFFSDSKNSPEIPWWLWWYCCWRWEWKKQRLVWVSWSSRNASSSRRLKSSSSSFLWFSLQERHCRVSDQLGLYSESSNRTPLFLWPIGVKRRKKKKRSWTQMPRFDLFSSPSKSKVKST